MTANGTADRTETVSGVVSEEEAVSVFCGAEDVSEVCQKGEELSRMLSIKRSDTKPQSEQTLCSMPASSSDASFMTVQTSKQCASY